MFENQHLGKNKYISVVQGQRRYLVEDFENLQGCFVFATKDENLALVQEISSDYYSFETYQGNNYIVYEEGFPINDYVFFKIVRPEQVISIPFEFGTISSITPNALNKNFEQLNKYVELLQETYNNQILKLDSEVTNNMLPNLKDGEIWLKEGNGYKGYNVTDLQKLIDELLEKIENEIKPAIEKFVKDELAKAQAIIDNMLVHDYVDIPYLNKPVVQIFIDTETNTVRECDNTKNEPLDAVGLKFTKEDGTIVTRCYFRGCYDKPTDFTLADGKYWQDQNSKDGLIKTTSSNDPNQPLKWQSVAFTVSNGKIYYDRGSAVLLKGKLGTIVFYEYETLNQAKADSSLQVGQLVMVAGDTTVGDLGQGLYKKTGADTFVAVPFGDCANLTAKVEIIEKEVDILSVQNVEKLKRLVAPLGTVATLQGYYTAGDGAGHQRILSDTDDGSGIPSYDGNFWNVVHNGEVNVSWFGAKGDGVTDDSAYINLAHKIKGITIQYPSKTYVINGHYSPSWVNKFQNYGGIFLNDNQKVLFSQNTRLLFTSDTENQGSFFQSQGKENIELWNIYGIGNRNGSGEFGHGLILWTSNSEGTGASTLEQWSKNVKLYNCTFENMNGDSFYFSGVDNLYFENLKAIRNRRNGITINAATNFNGKGYTAVEISGAQPEAGIDIETDFQNVLMENINIEGINIHNCGNGIWNILTSAKYSNIKLKNINFFNAKNSAYCRYYNNPQLNDKNSTVEWENVNFWNTDILLSESKNLIYSFDSARNKGNFVIKNLKLINTKNIDGNILYISNLNFPRLNLSNYTIVNGITSDTNLNVITFTGSRDESVISFNSDLKLKINNTNNVGFGNYNNSYKGFRNEIDFESRVGGTYLVETNGKVFWFFRTPIESKFFFKEGVSSIDIRPNSTTDRFLMPDKTISSTPTMDYECSVIWNQDLEMFIVTQLGEKLSIRNVLDTPYYTTKMQQEGVYGDFTTYMDEKTEFDNKKREEEKNLQEAYKVWLESNPDGTYEEFVNLIPNYSILMILPESMETPNEEPQPSEALLRFKEKYLP